MKLKFLYIILLLFQFSGFSQKSKLEEANKMFDSYAFIDAQKIYLEVANAGFESENLFKKLGDSYYFNNDLENAEKWYSKLFNLNKEQDKSYLFRYAQSLKSQQKYAIADSLILKYESLYFDDSTSTKVEPNYLELIEMQSGKFSLDTININSELSDFAPKVINDTLLIFASNRKQASSVQRIHEWNNEPYLDLYKVSLNDSLKPSGNVTRLPDVLNSKFHESSAVITKDGKTIYFTRNNFTKNKFGKSAKGYNYLKLYKSTLKQDGVWSDPVELPFNSDEYSVAHPCLNPEENKLYFASDMPGTKGMSDIFYVDIDSDGSYSKPINLGDKINTEFKENFPYVDEDNLLYFSSNGHIGLGGLDVFVSVIKKDGTYGDVFNVGRPVNSPKDDFSLYLNTKTKQGLFASNRDGGVGGDDIYILNQTDKLITNCTQYLSGYISTTNSEEGINEVKVELFDENLKLIETTLTDSQGNYKFDVDCDKRYVVRVSKDGFSTIEDLVKTGSNYEGELNQNFEVNKGSELGVTKASKGDDLKDLLQLDPIYFDLDEANIRPDAEVELQKVIAVLRQYPKMKIDIRSHTDSRAGDAYNKILSDKRAKSAMAYITTKGVNSTRISGRGYGETQLVNRCSNGVNCSEAEHALNRRAEFIILNENETPESIRAEVYSKVLNKQNQRPQLSLPKNGLNNSGYDFENSTNEVYTVQIGAYQPGKNPKFPQFQNVYFYTYPDGYKRYYSGIFETRVEADRYKAKVREAGIKGAFTVGLKGKTRF
ncbi:OmpA family protein [Psychroflexus sp. ALD_RP9]|uniref:OmpA family protein n=1 Tax=Psychroflexus sp. ALD_RP9 TaxID=2777186 RepID=UPI001A8FB036|nr:OmpA family protein [Psychroflexus sp. ALD_RP9]QSS97529.1 OmpA family protein [Psychroflexus sp. ALD_RP9]